MNLFNSSQCVGSMYSSIDINIIVFQKIKKLFTAYQIERLKYNIQDIVFF